MKKILFFIFYSSLVFTQPNYIRTLGTYYGDESMVIRDSKIDSEGNIIIVGLIKSTDSTNYLSIATANAHQETYGGGLTDGFIAKFNTDGQILWATYFGGENGDIIVNSSIDRFDNIHLIGVTKSATGIATLDSFQPNKIGTKDNFIAKLDKNGVLIWCTYYGAEDVGSVETHFPEEFINNKLFSTIAVNGDGAVLITTSTSNAIEMATAGVFQEFINHNNHSMIVKFSETGERQWATFYGVNHSRIYDLQCDNESVYVIGENIDCPPLLLNTYFSSDENYQPTIENCLDIFISKFDVTNGTRIWSRYYGGVSYESLFNKSLILYKNNLYITGLTASSSNITTPNSFQPTKTVGLSTFIAKFTTTDGQLVWGTYYGNYINEQNTRQIRISAFDDHLYIFGLTELENNFTTPNSYQENFSGYRDGFVLKFTTDGERDWATYFGGWNEDQVDNVLFKDDALFLLGMAKSTQNISTPNGIQPSLLNNGSLEEGVPSNIFIAKLEPNVLSLQEHQLGKVSVFPNPNNGSFTIVIPSDATAMLEVYDVLGKKMLQQKVFTNQTISTNNWAKGIYLAKTISENNIFETVKIIVE